MQIDKDKLLKWIENKEKEIIDPDNKGITRSDIYGTNAYNKEIQSQLELLDELKLYIINFQRR